MDDLRDKVNYFIMKFLFVLLNAMAILGLLDSLRQFERVCKILVVLCSCVVLIINVAGFSVYEIKMLTDKTSDASLLNHLYTMMAVIDQIRSILMFILVIIGTYFEESESLKVNLYLAKLYWTLLSLVNLVAITAASWNKQKDPTKYFYLSQSKTFTWSILAGQILACATIFGVLSIKCFGEEGYICTENGLAKMGGIVCVFCLIILIRITAENYCITQVKILQYLKSKVYPNIETKSSNDEQQTEGTLIAEERYSDQGLLIYFGGFLIGVIGGFIRLVLVMTFEIDLTVRQLLGMVNLTVIPVYWIYKSEKLQLVIRKYLSMDRN